MIQIYLPIAEISVNLVVMLGLGATVGFLSGMFGVGGGFLLTPLLMLSGIPPAIAVATGANQIVGTSVSGTLAQWRRGNVDLRMGFVLIVGGVAGAVVGTSIFQIIFITAIVTLLHATFNYTLDIMLAFLLIIGGVIGGQFGVRAGQKLRGEQLRALLALMVLCVALRILFDLVLTPSDLFSIVPVAGL